MVRIIKLLFFCPLLILSGALSCQSSPAFTPYSEGPKQGLFLMETFENLHHWKVKTFPNIPKHSRYQVVRERGKSILQCKSEGSASALVYKKAFSVYRYPKLRWKWKVENIYKNGDGKTREGDDYPLRIYVFFPYNPSRASALEKLKCESARLLYGYYPPHSSLNYIWANRDHPERILTSPYTGQVKMILLQKGKANLGHWMEEEVDLVEDYKRAFGKNPPPRAMVAVMSDSDNTGEKSISYLEYLKIFSNSKNKENEK